MFSERNFTVRLLKKRNKEYVLLLGKEKWFIKRNINSLERKGNVYK